MSYEIMTEDEDGDQVATSQGWGEFVDWVDTLDEDDFAELHQLTTDGWSNDLAALAEDIRDGIDVGSPGDDVLSIAKGILSFLKAHDLAEMVMITNGITA